MVHLTVKTLDGRDREFDVSDDLTVKQFKEHIAPTVNINAEVQRIIFHGKVLQDDKKLSDFDLNGKALHLVEKPPNRPAELPQNTVLPPQPSIRREVAQQQVMIGNVSIPVADINRVQLIESIRRVLDGLGDIGRRATINVNQSREGSVLDVVLNLRGLPSSELESPAFARVQHIRHVLHHINHSLYHIENDDLPRREENQSSNNAAATSNVDRIDAVSPIIPEGCVDSNHEATAPSSADVKPKESSSDETSSQAQASSDQGSSGETHDLDGVEPRTGEETGSRRNQRIRDAHVSELADLFDDVIRLQGRLRPHMSRYLNLLRNEVDYRNNTEEGRRSSRFFNGMQVIMHNVSHVYHVLSDLNIHFCQPPPRILEPRLNESDADITLHETEAQITMSFRRVDNSQPVAPDATASGNSSSFTNIRPFPPSSAAASSNTFNIRPGPPSFSNFPGIRNFPRDAAANYGIPNAQIQPGRVNVQVTPQGVMVSQAHSASFSFPSQTNLLQQQAAAAASSQSNTVGGDQAASSQSNAGSAAAGQTAQTPEDPQHQAPSFFQQLMQGVANAGVLLGLAPTMAGNRNVAPQSDAASSANSRQPETGQATLRPDLPFPQAQPGVGFQIGGRFPAMWPGSPQNMAQFMRARQPGFGFNAVPIQRMQQPNVQPNISQRHVFLPAGAVAGVHQHGPRAMAQTVIVNTSNSEPIFIGPRPPSDLPLFTVDPYLPCPSRHFDMRTRSPLNRRAAEVASAGSASNSTAQNVQNNGSQPNSTNTDDLTPLSDVTEFENTIDRILRSVLEGMNNQPITNPSSLGMFNFVPVSNSLAAQEGSAFQPQLSGLSGSNRPSPSHSPAAQRRVDVVVSNDDVSVSVADGNSSSDDMGNMLSRLFERLVQTPNATIADIMQTVGRDVDDPGTSVFSNITTILTQVLTFTDLIPLIRGTDLSPLDRARTPLRRYFIENVLNGNDRPSESDLRQAASRVVLDDLPQFQSLVENLQTKNNTDLAKSMLAAFEARLLDLFRLCFGFSDSANFGQCFYDIGWRCLREIVSLGVHFTDSGTVTFEDALVNYLNSGSTGMPNEIQGMMGISSREHVRAMINSHLLPLADVQQYVVRKSMEVPQAANAEASDVDQNMVPELEEVPSKESLKRSASEEVAENAPNWASGSTEDNEWKNHLPPDWVSVVEADIERQRSLPPQRPFSDSYINGMPLKRRKVVCESKSNLLVNSENLLRDALKKSVNETGCVPVTGELTEDVVNSSSLSTGLLESLEENLNDKIRRRTQHDPDFDAKRYPNIKKLFNS